ncbi:MAG: hypothetical protein RR994_00575 [Clostridia bacterium]
MVEKREVDKTKIGRELGGQDTIFWFDFKQQKFLQNIDTFYYSVKFKNDFTKNSEELPVMHFREFFKYHSESLGDGFDTCKELYFANMKKTLNLKPFSFAGFFTICMEVPDWFDVFMAPSVPCASDGGDSVTCEWVIQIRSYMLWMYGIHGAFEKSYEYIRGLADFFKLEIDFVQENRIDYCWHSNYLVNPEKFFSPENFYKMRCDRFHDAVFHTEKVGTSDFEIDYISMGRRSDKVFIRIYLKSKEVVEKGYKSWFFKVWFFHGLINRYDLYVYECCFVQHSWKYLDMARVKFYSEYGQDKEYVLQCKDILDEKTVLSPDALKKFADFLTPRINLIMNVEYQTMRKHTKSYELLRFKDNSAKMTCQRIYDFLDNRKLITDYLTHDVFRLVEPNVDTNKSRRDYVGFWKALRRCKSVDILIPPEDISLVRTYGRKLNGQIVLERIVKSSVTYGIYAKGKNSDNPMQDMVEALCVLNDNDVQDAVRFKNKKLRQFNEDELTDVVDIDVQHSWKVINAQTGECLSDSDCIMDFSEYQDLEVD